MPMIEFRPWPKIARYESTVVITEKLDGTNAAIVFDEITGEVFIQSRTRFITPASDNAGFARWVMDNLESLREDLSPGIHYGEWYGSGIQRNYGLKEKRFALFNTNRRDGAEFKTANLEVVPVLYEGPHDPKVIENLKACLLAEGSVAVPGFMRPEGLMVYWKNNNTILKVILDK